MKRQNTDLEQTKITEYLKLLMVHLLPKHSISRLAGRFAHSSISKFLIPWYIKAFDIDLTHVEKQIHEYRSLTEFFTRRLLPEARPVNSQEQTVVSPVDGTIAQFGVIHDGKLIQAKGVTFTVAELLADDTKLDAFEGGWYITIYLSPTDYHRIHMPVKGQPVKITYVPGTLFPVNQIGVKHVPGLFAKNERVVTYFKGTYGEFAMVKVGATIVGSVVVEYGPVRTNIRHGKLAHCELKGMDEYEKGQECARFEFGSTVILLFPPGALIPDRLQQGQKIKMGQRIGLLESASATK